MAAALADDADADDHAVVEWTPEDLQVCVSILLCGHACLLCLDHHAVLLVEAVMRVHFHSHNAPHIPEWVLH